MELQGGIEVWRQAAGMQTWRHRGMEVWSSGALKARLNPHLFCDNIIWVVLATRG